MDTLTSGFMRAGSLEELKAKGRLVVHGRHRPILLVYEGAQVFALDNRCPHMGFPLDRGSVEDGILTCHWHHARFELASGCTFDLWADDVPICPVEIRAGGEIWVKPKFDEAEQAAHWQRRLEDGLAHNLSLVIAKAVHGMLGSGRRSVAVVRQGALFGTHNRDGWDTGLTILTALGQLLPFLAEEDTHLALYHGLRRVAADCDGATPRRDRAPLISQPDLATLKRWLRRWVAVRHRDAAERTVLTAVNSGVAPGLLADFLFAAETDRVYADGGHSFDFINKAFECLDLIGWQHAADVLPSVVGQMTAARGAEDQRQQKLRGREVRAPLFSIFKPALLGNTLTTCLMMASAFVIYYANYALFATHLQLDLKLSPALVALPIALANTCFFLSSLFWGWLSERIGRRPAILIPAVLGVPTAFLYLMTQDYTLIVVGFALQGIFACGGMHVQYPAYLSERFPTEVRATAVAFCFHQGAIWGGLISPLLILYATTRQIGLSGPILVTTVVGLIIFIAAVLLSPETKGKILVADLTVA
jgi:nitrite reductase/ring-hydroxylating ferredoxin subunit